MEWFKFYGKDWLTDVKILSMNSVDRLLYLTLLCLASGEDEQGWIRSVDEYSIMKLSQLNDSVYEENNEWSRGEGFIERFRQKGMIRTTKNALNPETVDIYIIAFEYRQSRVSNAEKQRRYRERVKVSSVTKSNGVLLSSVTRVEENRIDKNITADAEKIDDDLSVEELDRYGDVKQPRWTKKPADKNSKTILQARETKEGRKFTNPIAQMSAIAQMIKAGYTDKQIQQEYDWLKTQKFWSRTGVDFLIVKSQIHKEHD